MTEIFQQFNIWSILDILVMSFLFYHVLILIKGTRAQQMLVGIIFFGGILVIMSRVSPLPTLKWMIDRFSPSLILIFVVLFQEDIRHVFSRVGRKTFLAGHDSLSSQQILDELTAAAATLQSKGIGALVAIERDIILTRYIEVGIYIDGKVSRELIESIFITKSPIHDGAVIIQQGRIAAAGCFLPLTERVDINPNYGTRHRAAIGLSQVTDAIVILISEETKKISLCFDGNIHTNLEPKELRKYLRNYLNPDIGANKGKTGNSSGQNWFQTIFVGKGK